MVVVCGNRIGLYKTSEYRERAGHIRRIGDAAFNFTDADAYIKKVNAERNDPNEPYPIIEGRYGDPTFYQGIGSYRGFKRFMQRYEHFKSSSDSNGYRISGNPRLKARLIKGWTQAPGYIPVPPHVGIYITPGVSGALDQIAAALILPPREKTGADNIVMPLWTYMTHLALVFKHQGEVKTCGISGEGQIDLESLERKIDENTKGILFATVGNPLSTAMEPDIFDNIIRLVSKKMEEFGKPIVIIADVIYEPFRRNQAKRIDPIQRAIKLDLGVPIIETSSFSKMMAIPGHRVGHLRYLWDPHSFPDYREDFTTSLELIYWPTLCPVSNQPQAALGDLFDSTNKKYPVEEELAPLAAMLVSLKELMKTKGGINTDTLFKKEESRSRLKEWDVPDGFFSSSIIAKTARKMANASLQAYSADINPETVEKFGRTAKDAKLVEEIERTNEEGVTIKFYRLREDILIPDIPIVDGQLQLFGISSKLDWIHMAALCGIETENGKYQEHKEYMRRTVFERVYHLAEGLDSLRSDGVYLHPAYYGPDGKLDPDRFNSLFLLWGIEGLRSYSPEGPSQAARVAMKCVESGLPIIADVPAELFLPREERNYQTSYLRHVSLQPKKEMDAMLDIIRIITRDL